jgi:type IV pilus assembly protein PilC
MLTALIYPVITCCLAIVAVIFMVTFVLPKFVDIFSKSNVPLPLPTRMLMGISGFVTSYWYILLAAMIGIITAIYLALKNPVGSRLFDRLILWLPGVGDVAGTVQSSLLLRTLGTLLQAGVPLVDSLAVAKDACKNSLFKDFVASVTSGVLQGEDLASNFAKSEIMSPSIKAMVGTGERTGNLPMVLNSIADHLDSIADKQAKRLSAVFEPAAIIVMGGVIGFIAVSVLFPLFRLTAAVKGAS